MNNHYWCSYRVSHPASGGYCCACERHDCESQTGYSRKCAGDDDLANIEWKPLSP